MDISAMPSGYCSSSARLRAFSIRVRLRIIIMYSTAMNTTPAGMTYQLREKMEISATAIAMTSIAT